ncbi:MAG: hypothetical protein LBV51_03195 [Acholeplasmatales bacterium]|jgi:hypothetical protein|nr:hypothetical protein [Acholeplasmatales bacterium]
MEKEYKVLNKKYDKEGLLALIKKLDPKSLVDILAENKVFFKKDLRVALLKSKLYPCVEALKEDRATLADELSYRLNFFAIYSEYQLQNLLHFLSEEDLNNYYDNLLELVVDNLENENVSYLSEASQTRSVYTVIDKDNLFNKVFVENVESDLDNLEKDLIRPVLYRGSLNTELRALGLKYGVTVPKRLKKQELIDRVITYVATESEEERDALSLKLKALPIVLIERFCKDNNIKVSSMLTKVDVIEYIIRELGKEALDTTIDFRKAYSFTDLQKDKYGIVDTKDLTSASLDDDDSEDKYVLVKVSSNGTSSVVETASVSTVEETKENEEVVQEIKEVQNKEVVEPVIKTVYVKTSEVDSAVVDELEQKVVYLTTLTKDYKIIEKETIIQKEIYINNPTSAELEEKAKEEAEEAAAKKHKLPLWLRILLAVIITLILIVLFLFIASVIYAIISQYYKGDFVTNTDLILSHIKIGDWVYIEWLREVLSSLNIGA